MHRKLLYSKVIEMLSWPFLLCCRFRLPHPLCFLVSSTSFGIIYEITLLSSSCSVSLSPSPITSQFTPLFLHWLLRFPASSAVWNCCCWSKGKMPMKRLVSTFLYLRIREKKKKKVSARSFMDTQFICCSKFYALNRSLQKLSV